MSADGNKEEVHHATEQGCGGQPAHLADEADPPQDGSGGIALPSPPLLAFCMYVDVNSGGGVLKALGAVSVGLPGPWGRRDL